MFILRRGVTYGIRLQAKPHRQAVHHFVATNNYIDTISSLRYPNTLKIVSRVSLNIEIVI